MSPWAALAVQLLGLVVLGTTLLDLLVTVFHPSAQSILTGRLNRGTWSLVRRLSRPLSARARRRVLSWTLPVAVAGLLLFWLAALLVGFALLYAPSMSRPGAFVAASGRPQWTDAFYVSGICLTSIGFGDIVPRTALLRAAVVAEGLCGLLVVGVAITYLLSVFPVLPLTRILATTLNEETNGKVDAVPMVRRYLAADSAEALAQRCRELATQLMLLSEAHITHPVLFYAHPSRAEKSFLRCLIVTQRLLAVLRYGVRQAEYPTLVRDPRVVGLEETLIAVLRELGGSLHLHVTPSSGADDTREMEGRYAALIAELRQAGLRGDAPPERKEQRTYIRFLLVTDPFINAYWANTGYSADELWGDHRPCVPAPSPLYADDDEDESR